MLEGGGSLAEIKNKLREIDKERQLKLCEKAFPVVVSIEREVGWNQLWDLAMTMGLRHTRGMQALTRLLCHPRRGAQPCPRCEEVLDDDVSLLQHVLATHLNIGLNESEVLERMAKADIKFVYCFWSLYV